MAMFIYNLWSNIYSKLLTFQGSREKLFFKISRNANPGIISFSLFSRKVSNLEYTLLHKLYLNMAIVVIFS
jgi:hypothetical protein